jgi:hypothetical protein
VSPLTAALVRLRQVANMYAERAGPGPDFAADLHLVLQAVVYSSDRIAELEAALGRCLSQSNTTPNVAPNTAPLGEGT